MGKLSPGGVARTCIRLRQYDLQGCFDFFGLGALIVVYTAMRGLESRQLGHRGPPGVPILTSSAVGLVREKTSWPGI